MGITWRLLFCCASTLLYPWERATMHFTETVPRTFGKTVLAADLKIRSDLAREGAGDGDVDGHGHGLAQEGVGERRGAGREGVTDACAISSKRGNFRLLVMVDLITFGLRPT